MFQGISPVLLYLMMAFGAACAFAALALMFRPPGPEGETRLELLGLKFNASSGSVIVFLIGALFLAAPAFVPERRPAAPGAGVAPGADPLRASVTGVEPGELPVRKRANGQEVEPNDTFDAANRLEVGGSVRGNADKRGDWFILPMDPAKASLSLRLRNNGGDCVLTVFSAEEKKLGETWNITENTMEATEILISGVSAVVFSIVPVSSSCSYEIFTEYL